MLSPSTPGEGVMPRSSGQEGPWPLGTYPTLLPSTLNPLLLSRGNAGPEGGSENQASAAQCRQGPQALTHPPTS